MDRKKRSTVSPWDDRMRDSLWNRNTIEDKIPKHPHKPDNIQETDYTKEKKADYTKKADPK